MNVFLNSVYEKAVLIDTGAFFALTDTSDERHALAMDLMLFIKREHYALYVTNAVMIEAYRLILYKRGIRSAHNFINNLIDDIQAGAIRFERMTEADEKKGCELIMKFKDHDITLTDSINFSIMQRIGIFKFFGFDSHCFLMGFEELTN